MKTNPLSYSDNSRTARYQRMEDNKAMLYTTVITHISQELMKCYDQLPIQIDRSERPSAGQRS